MKNKKFKEATGFLITFCVSAALVFLLLGAAFNETLMINGLRSIGIFFVGSMAFVWLAALMTKMGFLANED